MKEAESSEDPPLKALPKACKRCEVKKRSFFRSTLASHQPLARLVGERGKCLKNMSVALLRKMRFRKRKYFCGISAELEDRKY